MKSPEQGARTSVYAATSPELEAVSGKFFANSREARTSKASYDRALAERLWTVSDQLVGLA
jgi:retinol dehydrogenase-14